MGQSAGPLPEPISLNQKDFDVVARVFTLPVVPVPKRRRAPRISDQRYIEGQKVLVEAMRYLAQTDPDANREAIGLLSEHFRTQFRMSDRPAVD